MGIGAVVGGGDFGASFGWGFEFGGFGRQENRFAGDFAAFRFEASERLEEGAVIDSC